VSLSSSNSAVASVASTVNVGAGTSSVGFTVTTYTVCSNTTVTISATYNGSTKSAVLTVTPPPPTVSNGTASAITASGATLSATADPNGCATNVWFDYSLSGAMSPQSATTLVGIGSGTGTVGFYANLTGLSANTTYYYQTVASSAGGVVLGAVENFKTQ
jgi:hypothetical protein